MLVHTLRDVPRRVIVLLAVAVALVTMAGALAPGADAAVAARASSKPTVVLVHGAWADASSWKKVAAELRGDGYQVTSPELALLDVAADVTTVRAALDGIAGPKILVGHSYGGVVISQAAAGRSDVRALVYAAAFVPGEGDSILSLGAGFQPSEAFGHLIFTGEPFASPCFIDPAFFSQFFAQDLSAKKAAVLNAAQRPLNFANVFAPSGPVAWHTVPSWYAVSGADRMIDPAQQRWMADRIGAETVEYAHASHVGGITRHAGQFTGLVERAVRSTRP
jgi:pimeloyl-ACP methyl ester carboxylesterase